jgi:phage shock protein PspC (stress-responsive transcriptional regulator)
MNLQMFLLFCACLFFAGISAYFNMKSNTYLFKGIFLICMLITFGFAGYILVNSALPYFK